MKPPAIYTYLATGRAIPIGEPVTIRDVARELAMPLACLARYHGQARDCDDNPITVAEHCVRGADCLHAETAGAPLAFRRRLALAFLVHDAHEAAMSDPPKNFIALLGRKFAGVAGHRSLLADAVDEIKVEIDRGLALMPDLDQDERELVEIMDRRQAAAEIEFCFVRRGSARRAPVPLDVGLDDLELPDVTDRGIGGYPDDHRFWTRGRAAGEWLARWRMWSPLAKR